MSQPKEKRLEQRLDNFTKAFNLFSDAIVKNQEEAFDNIEKLQ